MLTEQIERTVHHCITAEAERLGCQVFAINGMPDHVHVVLDFSATTSIANLVKQMKGVSSSLAREVLGNATVFRWADGYAVFSLSRAHRDSAVAYVQNQKRHHADASTRPAWEEAPTGDT